MLLPLLLNNLLKQQLPSPAPDTARGGGYILHRGASIKSWKKHSKLREQLEALFERFSNSGREPIQEAVRELVTPHISASKGGTEHIRIDWGSLQNDVEAVHRLIELYHLQLDKEVDEEESIMLLLL